MFYARDKESLQILQLDKKGEESPVLITHAVEEKREENIVELISNNEAYILNWSNKENSVCLYRFNKEEKAFDQNEEK